MPDMEEFLGIAIWVLIGFLIVNSTLLWFSAQPTIAGANAFGLQGLTPDYSLQPSDVNNLKTNIAAQDCAIASSGDLDYSLCLISQFAGSVVQSATNATSLIGKVSGLLWNLLFAWNTVLNATLGLIVGGELFIMIFTLIFGGIEIAAIFIIFIKVAGIIRGGS